VALSVRAVAALLLLGSLRASGAPVILGRCPLERVVRIEPGRFAAPDSDCLLLAQDLGRVELSRSSQPGRANLNLLRLAIVHLEPTGPATIWTSEPLAGSGATALGLSGTAWASGDLDRDGRDELLLFHAGLCRVLRFAPGALRRESEVRDGASGAAPYSARPTPGIPTEETLACPAAAVAAATLCDIDSDGTTDIVTIEPSGLSAVDDVRLLRVYQVAGKELVPRHQAGIGLNWGAATEVALLGAARLDDYPGFLPVVAGVRADPRPSSYLVLYQPDSGPPILTANPFPWQEWFSKTRVLPAGELSLFNVGDTLVGYGYFVPGARPSGPSQSFAALQDGEWRLLSLTNAGARLSGPVCRLCYRGTDGWLELRDNLLYFHPGDVFRWR
jgi:hypothetical protein